MIRSEEYFFRICGASYFYPKGLHFGAVTCEACKKFFVRYLNNQSVKSVCKRKTEDCVITMKTRADCFFCRLKKCFQVGMNVNSRLSPFDKLDYCLEATFNFIYNSNQTDKSVKMQSYKEIQCRVCLAPSSGTHFGVITCEACKVEINFKK